MNRLAPRTVYLWMSVGQSILFRLVFTVNMVYQATVVGLSPLQLVLVGTTLEVSYFLFEVPTGIVADARSRKLSVLMGFVLIGAGFMVEAIPRFWAVLLAQVLWGIGATFTSGATEAWIIDEMAAAGDPTPTGDLFLQATQIGRIGGLVGIGLSVGLASFVHIRLPIFLGGLLFWVLAGLMAVMMSEDGFQPAPVEERNSWQQMGHILQSGIALVRLRPILISILGISLIYGMYSEGWDRLWTPHLLESFTLPTVGNLEPVVWFGLIDAVAMFLTLGAAGITRRILNTERSRTLMQALLAIHFVLMGSILVFSFSGSLWLALAALWTVGIARSLAYPLHMAWINQHIDSNVRATVISFEGQLNAVGQIVGGPPVGYVGNVVSLRVALSLGALILAPAIPIYLRLLRRDPGIVSAPEFTPPT